MWMCTQESLGIWFQWDPLALLVNPILCDRRSVGERGHVLANEQSKGGIIFRSTGAVVDASSAPFVVPKLSEHHTFHHRTECVRKHTHTHGLLSVEQLMPVDVVHHRVVGFNPFPSLYRVASIGRVRRP